ncbi:BTAD domain-containing putative transcriptional regulator [Bradyrhizobium sp. CSS354]|uniref:BTAD domain-containing putative transcriptional regulator n=1 Tax=Bradyrhizobium sp. CSS354 TaxID=2699172 RepID=UPI0023B0BA6E|nr:BTAD domain-containing putative transcriptional regulator [Bradyrhizobium sp. CSS354]MDE5462204.1 AAA family ATPase [Bradyrhizobium sp. CSS354]
MDGVPRPRFDLSLLGRFELTGPDGVVDLPSKKLAGLLAYLACTAPRPQPREKLTALLWGSHFDAQAKQNLRQALFRLRKVLGQDVLESDGEVVSLNAAFIQSDVGRFEALVREGSRDALGAAADLYQGQLVDDVIVGEEGWNEWLTGERERLLELALGAMIGLGEQELAAGRAERALKAGQRAVALNNLREDAHRLIVQALAATGRKPEALKHYQDLVALLKHELNTEPDAATRSLIAELRSRSPPASSPAVKEAARSALAQPDRLSVAAPFADKIDPAQELKAGNPAARSDAASSAGTVDSGSSERRQLTIMACNIVDSMAISARLDPEDMLDVITSFHRVIDEAVSQFGGFVAQYLGDGVLIYFGYPAADEHDTEQAVRAGLAILDAVRKLKADSRVPLQLRVGIATGLVVVGEQLGTGETAKRVAIGGTPNLAARLQAIAPAGEVVIAASTHRLVGRMFDCRALAAIEVEGLSQPVEAWQVRGETAGVSRFEARRASAQSALVGRQEEIDLLLRRWDQSKLGEGRVVLLSGEPGIGKSRIAESLLDKLEGEPRACLRYSCSPHHTHSPLYPFIAQLELAARFEPGGDSTAKLDKLEAMLRPTSKNLPRDVALIAELLGVPADERYPAVAVSPQQKREMTLAALLDQLDGAAAQGRALILFEDAHWIDPTSQDLLDRMVARAAGLPVLLVVTVRPELQPGWVGEPHVSMLPLNRLSRRDSAAIIAGIARDRPLPDAVVEQVLARADGVPLFIEELTSALLESGALRQSADGYALDGPLPELAVPTTLQASLVARLDRLPSVRDVAQIGAAIGREFSHKLIAAVSALAPMDLDAALGRLTGAGLISRRGTPPEVIYLFKHALVQDAAYATMVRSRRQPLHASIAAALIERFSALAETLPEVVAHHFTEAGRASEAIVYWLKAGRLARARSANREAVSSFERARSLLQALPESQSTLEQGCDLRLELRPVLLELGRSPQMWECLREAEALAERLNDDSRRGRVYGFVTVAHSLCGELDEALAAGSRALEVAARLDDLRLRIVTTSLLVQVHHARGEYDRVSELATGNLTALPAEWVHETFGLGGPPSVWDRGCLIMSLAERGRFAEAARYEAEAIGIAESTRHAFTISMALFAASVLHLLKGDFGHALARIERWLAVARTGNFHFHLAWGIASSAWPLAQLGETSQAVSRIKEGEQLLERLAAGGVLANLAWFFFVLARATLLLGRCDEARRLGERALEFCSSQPGFAAHAQHLLGDVAAHPNQFDAGRGELHYRQALALAKGLGMDPLVAHCHRGLGKLYLQTGTREQAQSHVVVATAMYRNMGMTHWLEQAELRSL